MDSEKKRRKSRFFPGLLLGLIIGAAAVIFAPRWWQAYVPAVLLPSGVVQGEVMEKSADPERLLLKLATEEGVLLASFTEQIDEIDLLVAEGDRLSLRVPRYEPFLTDPTIERVVEALAETETKPEMATKPEPRPEPEPEIALDDEPAPTAPPAPLEAEETSTTTTLPPP